MANEDQNATRNAFQNEALKADRGLHFLSMLTCKLYLKSSNNREIGRVLPGRFCSSIQMRHILLRKKPTLSGLVSNFENPTTNHHVILK